MKSIFDCTTYTEYLRQALSKQGESRGSRSELARRLRCEPSFISRMLAEKVHLSMEHAIEVSRFLNHTMEEERCFMLLIQKGKAGTRALQSYFEKDLQALRAKRSLIQERVQVETNLTLGDQVAYYGAWHVTAIHILLSIPGFDTRDSIATKLKLPVSQVASALEFLTRSGLVSERGGRYKIENFRTHLAKDSALLPRHHSNWRIRTIQSLDCEREHDLHYSGVFSLSREDLQRIRESILALIERNEPVIRASKEEVLCHIGFDLFEI